jgi:hypothetical protein
MAPTLTAPDPAVFPEDVRRFAAERGVSDYLVPLYELTKQCFGGVEVRVLHESDPEIAGLQWIVYEVAAADWELDRYRTAHDGWLAGFHRMCPASVRGAFVLGER